MLPNEKRNP